MGYGVFNFDVNGCTVGELMNRNYFEIIKDIVPDFENADNNLIETVSKERNDLSEDLKVFLTRGSKKIRSALVFLTAKALGFDTDEKIIGVANSVELVHNASLMHDDVIDKAQSRRNQKTFNEVYDNFVSIIAGDYLLTLSLEYVVKLNNSRILNMLLDTLKTLCVGEIDQHFCKNEIFKLEDYIKKSYEKTGKLFETAVCSTAIILNKENQELKDFSINFGIAFQLKDDYNNIYKSETSTDINDGIFTAPVIFAAKDYPAINTYEPDKIYEIVKNEKYENMMKNLIKEYTDKAVKNIEFLEETSYKQTLVELCRFLEA